MFRIKHPNFDFGHVAIENIFINDFMPMANGVQIKVYIIGYKSVIDKDENFKTNNYSIAKHLNIPLTDVLDAWNFWENKGIIIKHKKANPIDENDYDIEFLSLIQLYIEKNFKTEKTIKKNSTPKDLISATYNPKLKEMYYLIDQLMRRPLEPSERLKILDWINNYNFDPDLVVRAFEYSIESKDKKNLNYIKAILLSWYDDGILSIKDVEEKLMKENNIYTKYKKIYSFLGYSKKLPSEGDKEIMDIWIKNFENNFDFLLFLLKEGSKKTSNVNMNYMDKIVSDVYDKNIKTIEDFKKFEKKESKSNPKKTSLKSKATNKFHNFSPDTDKYTNRELEKILGIKK